MHVTACVCVGFNIHTDIRICLHVIICFSVICEVHFSLSKRKENFLLLIGFVCPLQCVVLVLFVVCFPTIMTCIVCIACMYWLYTHMVQFLHTPTQEFKLPLPPWGLPWNKIKRMFSKKCDKIKNTLNRRTKLAARLSTSSSKKRAFFGCKNFYRLNRQWQGLIPHVPTERYIHTQTHVYGTWICDSLHSSSEQRVGCLYHTR